MKEHPLQIMNIKDLFSFRHYIRKNNIKGRVIQNKFCSKANSFLRIAIALPLESATLVIDDDCKQTIDSFEKGYIYV